MLVEAEEEEDDEQVAAEPKFKIEDEVVETARDTAFKN